MLLATGASIGIKAISELYQFIVSLGSLIDKMHSDKQRMNGNDFGPTPFMHCMEKSQKISAI